MYVLSKASPAEPKDTECKKDAANNDWGQSPFGDRLSIIRRKLLVIPWLQNHNEESGENFSHDHTKKRKTADASIEAVDLLEDDGVHGKE